MTKNCLTLKHTGTARVLHTPLSLALPTRDFSSAKYQTRCIWDTGCSNTTITQKVVDALGLIPTGYTTVNTASETNKHTSTYQIDLFLSDHLVFPNITVNLGVIFDGIDCLLGMDIIGTGDLSVTNFKGNTCLSFRHPSSHEIDFYKHPDTTIKPAKDIPPGQTGTNKTPPKKKRRK